jgi:uncharacterized protein (TIGR03435 family)
MMSTIRPTSPLGKPLLPLAATFLALATIAPPYISAQSQASAPPQPAFEVATVRPSPPNHGYTSISPFGTDRFTAANASLSYLIQLAYSIDGRHQLSGAPDWLDSEFFDISAKAADGTHLTYEELQPLLQQLLQDRFHLEAHRETRNLPGYVLLVAKGTPKLHITKGGAPYGYIFSGKLRLQNSEIDSLAATLVTPVGRPVLNKTGIQGNYDIKLDYAAEGATDSTLPSIFTALQEQLGLKLESQKVPVQMLVIDHIDKTPTEN